MTVGNPRSQFLANLYVMRGGGRAHDDRASQDLVDEIRVLKAEKNAILLSHYYMPPELQIRTARGGVADVVGDSLGLSQAAMHADAEVIIFCGVRFMAETAKILNPGKSVLLPSSLAECSLASSITGADVRRLRELHPGSPVIAYINTYAETKAECDICCTSRNAVAIASSLAGEELMFVPDVYMGRNLRRRIESETGKRLILWHGRCEVHEQFTAPRINALMANYPDAEVLVHWEVPQDTAEIAERQGNGLVGSTNEIIAHVGKSEARRFIIGSECDLGATLRGMFPGREFISPCVKCKYMKSITLEATRDALRAVGTDNAHHFEITFATDLLDRARVPLERMMLLS